jgi:hypothetical protein
VIERGHSFGFPLETVAAPGIRRQFPGEDLQGDSPMQLAIVGDEDLSHAAGTDPLQDLVVREAGADHGMVLISIALTPADERQNYDS